MWLRRFYFLLLSVARVVYGLPFVYILIEIMMNVSVQAVSVQIARLIVHNQDAQNLDATDALRKDQKRKKEEKRKLRKRKGEIFALLAPMIWSMTGRQT